MAGTRPGGRPRLGRLRSGLATLVWLAAVACALVLATGALLVALELDADHAVVAAVTDGARVLDLGGIASFSGPDAAVETALVDWGVAAVAYLLVGGVLDRVLRPSM